MVSVVACLLQCIQGCIVEWFRRADLDDHALRWHRSVQTVNDEARAGIDHAEVVADDAFHAPLEEHALHHATRREVGVVERGRSIGSVAVQQFVAEHLSVDVDQGLASEVDLGGHATVLITLRVTAVRDRIRLTRRSCLPAPPPVCATSHVCIGRAVAELK